MFIVLLILGKAARLILQLKIGLGVVRAGELEERVEVKLGDCLFLVEVQLFEDVHDAVLDGGESKYLHADVVDNLAFVEVGEAWMQFGARIGL